MSATVTNPGFSSQLDVMPCAFESNPEFGDPFNDLPIGIYRGTSHGRILSANNTLLRMFASASLDELNETLEELGFKLLIEQPELEHRLNQDGEIKGFESECLLRNGRRIFTRENVRA